MLLVHKLSLKRLEIQSTFSPETGKQRVVIIIIGFPYFIWVLHLFLILFLILMVLFVMVIVVVVMVFFVFSVLVLMVLSILSYGKTEHSTTWLLRDCLVNLKANMKQSMIILTSILSRTLLLCFLWWRFSWACGAFFVFDQNFSHQLRRTGDLLTWLQL